MVALRTAVGVRPRKRVEKVDATEYDLGMSGSGVDERVHLSWRLDLCVGRLEDGYEFRKR